MRPSYAAAQSSRSTFSATAPPRLLLALPLVLAAVALIFQFTSHHPGADSAAYGLFNEKEFMRRSDSLPRLEHQLRKRGVAAGAGAGLPMRLPLPTGLAGQEWAWPGPAAAGPKVAFTVTTAESVPQIKVWLAYHRAIGVSLFYLFTEGQAGTEAAMASLRREAGVTVVPKDESLAQRHRDSRIWNETWLSAFFNKPCNHELFVTQSLNMEIGIGLARADGAEWILHVDTDELIYPGGTRDYSLQQVLAMVPADVDLLVFPNYESLAERDDVADPFLEVSLFKRNYAHVVGDVYFKSYATVARGNPNYFTTYGNGKSAARVTPGLRPNGAHRWHSYTKSPKEWSSDQAAVLHYTYNRFSDLRSRRDRCDCAPTEEDAKRCFILPFDRAAFLEASLKGDEELMDFFHDRLVWWDQEAVKDLTQKGLFVRLYAPQVMIRGFQEAAARRAEGAAARSAAAALLADGGGVREGEEEARSDGDGGEWEEEAAAQGQGGSAGSAGTVAEDSEATSLGDPRREEGAQVAGEEQQVEEGRADATANVSAAERQEGGQAAALGRRGGTDGGAATDTGLPRGTPQSQGAVATADGIGGIFSVRSERRKRQQGAAR